MTFFRKPFMIFIRCTIMISLLQGSGESTRALKVGDNFYLYMPVILQNYPVPPQPTISRYMGYNNGYQNDLDFTKMYNMGCSEGLATPNDFSSYVILNFGEPWHENGNYGTKLFDNPYYSFITVDIIYDLVSYYLHGYYQCSPDNTRLNLGVGTTNYGPHVTYGHGWAWAQLVNDIQDWIETSPSYADKVSVVAAIDNELDWNTPEISLAWQSGYRDNASIFYLYFGDCAACPTVENPGSLPNNFWSVDDIYTMANGTYYSLALPQIYSKDRVNAQQWQYLSLYGYVESYGSILFMGSMTQAHACQEMGDCDSGTPYAVDNSPFEGWSQLYAELANDPRTYQYDIPISTDISWEN